jgi:glycerol 3-phosphatase-2
VLTGIDRPKHVLAAPPTSRPTYILADLRELHEMAAAPARTRSIGRVPAATMWMSAPSIRTAASRTLVTSPRTTGFRVPEQLYADPFHRP